MNNIPIQIYHLFPNLKFDKIAEVKAPMSYKYNCIMHTIGGKMLHVWPSDKRPLCKDIEKITFWPPELPNDESLDNFLKMYKMFKYELCDDGSYDNKYRKIAIYCKKDTDIVTHAALQYGPNIWTSKLGRGGVIQHQLFSLEGDIYGEVRQFIQRPRSLTRDVDFAVLSSYIPSEVTG